jgi:hypothetical protein
MKHYQATSDNRTDFSKSLIQGVDTALMLYAGNKATQQSVQTMDSGSITLALGVPGSARV